MLKFTSSVIRKSSMCDETTIFNLTARLGLNMHCIHSGTSNIVNVEEASTGNRHFEPDHTHPYVCSPISPAVLVAVINNGGCGTRENRLACEVKHEDTRRSARHFQGHSTSPDPRYPQCTKYRLLNANGTTSSRSPTSTVARCARPRENMCEAGQRPVTHKQAEITVG